MSAPPSEPVRRRRRGAQLEDALLEAAWDELVEAGYAHLTMESVAARARTGIAVLYRRWANKDELVLAALDHYRHARPIEIADTGSLRTDLIEQLTVTSEARAAVFAVGLAVARSGISLPTGATPARLRERVMGRQPRPRERTVYRRAHDRGELDLDRVPAAVLAMPFDLLREELLMHLAPPRPARIRSIVDELFLPLLRAHTDRGVTTHAPLSASLGPARSR